MYVAVAASRNICMIETSVARQNALNLPHDSLLGDYPVADSGYDEMCSSPGTLRPHWRDLMQFLDETGGEELDRRHSEVQRLLQEDGVTYNAYDDSRNAQRHWLVDPIPLLMTGEEWSDLAAGMEQRSRLLNALMTDLYGPRTTIRQGWLPPELIYAYPGFLHACHQSLPNGSRWLIFHGVDLARGPDGVFRVYGDRSPVTVWRWLHVGEPHHSGSGVADALSRCASAPIGQLPGDRTRHSGRIGPS
jgi:hypothetical protein